ncbi:hypothetical protein ACHAXT_001686 [Thalassiosira profunda]
MHRRGGVSSFALTAADTPASSPLDDFLGGIFGDDKKGNDKSDGGDEKAGGAPGSGAGETESLDEMSLSSFQEVLDKRQDEAGKDDEAAAEDEAREFDGYALRDAIYEKWGECFDVDFQRVDSYALISRLARFFWRRAYGFRNVYLNILPFRLGGRRFRHQTEMDYLCHLQAVVEILVKYNQLDYVLVQLEETTKKPRAGTSPLIAVPLRLDLTPEQVDKILG